MRHQRHRPTHFVDKGPIAVQGAASPWYNQATNATRTLKAAEDVDGVTNRLSASPMGGSTMPFLRRDGETGGFASGGGGSDGADLDDTGANIQDVNMNDLYFDRVSITEVLQDVPLPELIVVPAGWKQWKQWKAKYRDVRELLHPINTSLHGTLLSPVSTTPLCHH